MWFILLGGILGFWLGLNIGVRCHEILLMPVSDLFRKK